MKSLAVPLPAPLRKKLAQPGSRVLDVGCGNSALDIATHLVDAMPDSNAERGGDLEIPEGKVFREGRIEEIPFPDASFDFVHTSHILEHVESPAAAIEEIERVAFAGYVETPAAVVEQCSNFAAGRGGWDFHRWYVWAFPEQDRLYFRPKTAAAAAVFCDCRFGRATQEMLVFKEFQDIYAHFPYFCVMTQLVWQERVPFAVWAETQQGRGHGLHGCDCAYAAFFAHVRRYFRSLPLLLRRRRLKRAAPEVYAILRRELHAPSEH